jgi:SWI/SNF-related matrix-associated actin-dependent regulator 1 of chromatin subfamily A
VFCWHSEAIDELAKKLKRFDPVCIKGDTPAEKRQSIVDLFQREDDIRVFIGNIKAAGVGITLTASHTVVFFELSWNEMQNRQAMDRCHRIGQANSVNIHFLNFAGTMDDRVVKSCKAKWEDFSSVTA